MLRLIEWSRNGGIRQSRSPQREKHPDFSVVLVVAALWAFVASVRMMNLERLQDDFSTRNVAELADAVISAENAPPACNTGAQNTFEPGRKRRAKCLDYLSLVFPGADAFAVARMLPGFAFEACDRGFHGYRKSLRAEGCTIFYDAAGMYARQMGVLVQLSGDGCRFLESHVEGHSWGQFVGRALREGAHCTRIDVAFDDKTGDRSAADLVAMAETGMIVTRAKEIHPQTSLTSDGKRHCTGLIIGSRQSESYARFYCKQTQLRSQTGLNVGPWLRYEFEFKGGTADAVAKLVATDDWMKIQGLCRAFCDFKTPSGDSNRSRWAVQRWWRKLIGCRDVFRLSLSRWKSQSIERVKENVRRQWAPNIAMVVEADGGCLDFILDLLDEGKRRWRGKHQMMLGAVACR